MLAAAAADCPDIDHLVRVTKAAGDVLRARILQVLHTESFAVLEMGRIFAMAQPAISHHLRILSEAGLVTKRREGTSIFYQRTNAVGQPLLEALFAAIDETSPTRSVQKQIAAVHKARQQHTTDYFANRADALSTQREMICAPDVYTSAVIEAAAIDTRTNKKSALEIGPGGGDLLARLSPFFEQVLAIDSSAEMLAEASDTVNSLTNVELRQENFDHLTPNRQFDLILATMVLHHQPSPGQFFARVKQQLALQGLFVIADLCPHAHEWAKQHCGDLWLGFHTEQLTEWADRAGLIICHQQLLAQKNGFTVQVLALAHTSFERRTEHNH